MPEEMSLSSKLWIWGPFKNWTQKLENRRLQIYKGKIEEKIEGTLFLEGRQTKPGAARAFIFF